MHGSESERGTESDLRADVREAESGGRVVGMVDMLVRCGGRMEEEREKVKGKNVPKSGKIFSHVVGEDCTEEFANKEWSLVSIGLFESES